MDVINLDTVEDIKLNFELHKPICRCCLSTERKMFNTVIFSAYFFDLTGINITVSDGMPHWICWECAALLRNAVRFRQKVLRAHSLLYEYLTRCAPFPLDAQDPELVMYASPHLSVSNTLTFETNGKGKLGFLKDLQHEKKEGNTELDGIDLPLLDSKVEEEIKEENGFSDYDDNITLDEFRTNEGKITEEELNKILQERLVKDTEIEVEVKKKKKKKSSKKEKEDKVRKKRASNNAGPDSDEPNERKSVRTQIELDPNKIRVVTLNPEEQVKQREEESKTSLKFPFQCSLCFKGFNFEAKLQNHMHKHSPSRGPFECKFCHMFLPTSYSYSVHSLIHTRRYECVKCGRRMTDRSSILDHYRTQHEGMMTLYTCQFCGKVSNNSKTHRGHLRNHHSGERPKCDQCGKTFVNADSLAEHQQIHQGIKNYECAVCEARFRTRTQIKHHQLKHCSSKDFYCVECDTRFKSSHSLRQHLQKSLKHKDINSLKVTIPSGRSRSPVWAQGEQSSRRGVQVPVRHVPQAVRERGAGVAAHARAARGRARARVRAVRRGAGECGLAREARAQRARGPAAPRAPRVPRLRQGLPRQERAAQPRAHAHRREALPLRALPARLLAAHRHAHAPQARAPQRQADPQAHKGHTSAGSSGTQAGGWTAGVDYTAVAELRAVLPAPGLTMSLYNGLRDVARLVTLSV